MATNELSSVSYQPQGLGALSSLLFLTLRLRVSLYGALPGIECHTCSDGRARLGPPLLDQPQGVGEPWIAFSTLIALD